MSSKQRILRLEVFFLLSLFFVLFSCHKTDISDTSPAGTLSLSKTAIRIDTAIGSSDSFTVQSTVQWTASLSPGADWLRIDKNSGGAGNTQIKLIIVANDNSLLIQEATITVSAAGLPPVRLTVTKKSFTFRVDYHKLLGGTEEDSPGRPMAKTPDGGIVLVSAASSNNGDVHGQHGNADFWIVKLNAGGDTVWTKTYGGSEEDRGASIITTPDGGYMVCGGTSSRDGDVHHPKGGPDAWLLKLDRNGDTLWTKTYGGTNSDQANSIITTADGGYAVAGYTASNDGDVTKNNGGGDLWIMKLTANGDIVWTKTYGGSEWDEADAIIATADGGFALAGLTNSNDQDVVGFHVSPFFSFDMWIVRLDAAGNKLWAKVLGGTGNESALSIINVAGGFVLTGYTTSNDGDVTGYHGRTSFFTDMWVAKINDAGTIVWAKAYGGSFDDAGIAVIATADGGYVIAGGTSSTDGDVTGYHNAVPGTEDMWLVKLNADGVLQWAKAIGGTGDEICTSIIPVPDGYILSGFTDSNDGDLSGAGYHGGYDIGVVKLFVQ